MKRSTRQELRSAALAIRKAAFAAAGKRVQVASASRSIPALGEAVLRVNTADGGMLARRLSRRNALPQSVLVADLGLFRIEVAATPKAELAGHIAVVSGAGSGLGHSIAVGLAQAGACVGIADIDIAAATKTASHIAQHSGATAALPIRCDVTSPAAVRRALNIVLDQWGGVDVLVNAAGIAPAYPLVDLPVREWRLALEVNLTGYFLMAQETARIMIRQGMGGSIINLSSKSGLEASRDNTAYNATKAGEIHVARGWCLELGEHGIRVNAVAPGNVFEGSRIWNPEYIRVCARKYGIGPEEVIPYYVGRTALKRQIAGQDVADAVVFLCSDRASKITGQTLVVDAGQVMVR